MSRPAPRLYLITPPKFELEVFAPTLDETLQAGDIACLQIRLKQPDGSPVEDDTIRRAVEILCPLAQQHNVAVLLNDRPERPSIDEVGGEERSGLPPNSSILIIR